MLDPRLYEGREQTYIKHVVLKRYLQKLAYKKGWYGGTINYVDGFAGPWQHASEQLEDTSPFIAIEELSQARERLRQIGRPPLRIRCLFIEKDQEAWELLSGQLDKVQDIEVRAVRGEFEEQIDTVGRFAVGGDRPFSFVFIDPTGWTGFSLDVIAPILRQEPGEVLINFMMQHIQRFIDHEQAENAESFDRLFGSREYRKRWTGLTGLDREDEIVRAYCERIRGVGRFRYVASSTILHPHSDRTHFHLVYATRRIEGLRVFRNDAERPADKEQQQARQDLRNKREFQQSGQYSLFPDSPRRSYSDELRERYQDRAFRHLKALLKRRRRMLFDDVEAEALVFPLMNTRALKDWLLEQQDRGMLRFDGLSSRGRVPQAGQRHWIVLS